MRLTILVLVLAGCANMRTREKFNARMDDWKGQSGDALMQAWGTPRQVVEKRDGGRMLSFVTELGCSVSIATDKDDKITTWTADGAGVCISD